MDNTFDIVKFQIINSFLSIKSSEFTYDKIFIFAFLYYLYKNKYFITDYINNYINKDKSIITIEGKRHFNSGRCFSRYDELYSIRFKAIWNYVNQHFKELKINSIKEFSATCGQYNDYGEKMTNSIDEYNNDTFIVDQYLPFEIFNDIYCKVVISENDYENNDNNNIKKTREDIIMLTIYSWKYNVSDINNKINNVVNNYEDKLKIRRKDKLFIYSLETFDDRDSYNKFRWEEIEFKSNKSFDNLFFNNKDNFINKINFFCNNEKFYIKNGIPYTLGIMLDGNPGTGKTSVIKCLANYLNRHLVVINMNKIKTNSELNNYFFENTYSNKNKEGSISFRNKIYVFEDIDCCLNIVTDRKKLKNENCDENGDNYDDDSDDSNYYNSDIEENKKQRKKNIKNIFKVKDNPDKLSLGHVLNLIDGIKETPGRILVITSNYVNRIDSALKRPGRIDIKLTLTYVNYDTLNDMYMYYFNENLNIDDDNIKNIINYCITPAEITNILVNSDDKIEFIKLLNELIILK